jgi:hypothetical protein
MPMRTTILLVFAHRASEGAQVEASGSAILSVADSCRDATVITQDDVSGPDSHSRRFKATTNEGGRTFAEERLGVSNISSVGGGRCHITISI